MKKRKKMERKMKKKMRRKLSLLLVDVVESQVKKLYQHLLKRKNQVREEERPRKLQNQMIMMMLMTKMKMKRLLKRVARRNQQLLKNSKRDKITLISLMLSRLMRLLKELQMISKITVVHSVPTENYLELFIQVITLSLKSQSNQRPRFLLYLLREVLMQMKLFWKLFFKIRTEKVLISFFKPFKRSLIFLLLPILNALWKKFTLVSMIDSPMVFPQEKYRWLEEVKKVIMLSLLILTLSQKLLIGTRTRDSFSLFLKMKLKFNSWNS